MHIPKNASVIILFLCLLSFAAKAQYRGGDGDGYAMASTSNITLGEAEISAANYAVNIYPNPVSNTANLTIALSGYSYFFSDITICNIYGMQVYKTQIYQDKNLIIDLTAKHFSSGIYIVKLNGLDGKSIQHKLVVN